MLKYSLTEGNFDDMNVLVNPGELPLGMAGEAQRVADKTHKRTLPPNTIGETDYEAIFAQMTKFLNGKKSGMKMPPLFVESGYQGELINIAKATLEHICGKVGRDPSFFRVLPIDVLLFKLSKMCATDDGSVSEFSSVLHAKDLLTRELNVLCEVGCQFHTEKDVYLHCCLSKVRQYGFTITNCCLDDLTKKIPGRHFPSEFIAVNADDPNIDEDDEIEGKKGSLVDAFGELRVNFTGSSSTDRDASNNSGSSQQAAMSWGGTGTSKGQFQVAAKSPGPSANVHHSKLNKLSCEPLSTVPEEPSSTTLSLAGTSLQYGSVSNDESSRGDPTMSFTYDDESTRELNYFGGFIRNMPLSRVSHWSIRRQK